MKDIAAALFSHYILDGVRMEGTPFSALYDCLDGNGTIDTPDRKFPDIVDEYLDKSPTTLTYDSSKVEEYLAEILRTHFDRKAVDLDYPVIWTKAAIDSLLLECLFKDGHFTLQDIMLMAIWEWHDKAPGNMAAFYDSTVAAGNHLFDLGVKLDRYFVENSWKDCTLELSVRSRMSSRRKCSATMNTGGLADASDWIIYVPFESARLQLGGSALSKVLGQTGGAEMDLADPDYFIDCYEVVRELVEDGVVTAGASVGRGGLITAAEKFRGRAGFSIDIAKILSARGENDIIKLLFAEMPGVLLQIKDSDYDYVDSQFLLQEVAYFPLGHPDESMHCIRIDSNGTNSITSILESLLNQASEGED